MTNRLFVYNDTVGFYLGYVMKINYNKCLDLVQLKFVSADNPDIYIITESINVSLIDRVYQAIINVICNCNITGQPIFDVDYEIKEVLNGLENNEEIESE